jgi:TFIIF-interacting CTD phosphatase-like protein
VIEKREGLAEFLERLCARYQVHLFTRSAEVYATAIMEAVLQPLASSSSHYFYSSCSGWTSWRIKDLTTILSSYQRSSGKSMDELLARTVLVDDDDTNFIPQPSNGILVPGFYGYKSLEEVAKDDALQAVATLLQELEPNHIDVRLIIPERFPRRPELLAYDEEYCEYRKTKTP